MIGRGVSIERRDVLIFGAAGAVLVGTPIEAAVSAPQDYKSLLTGLEEVGGLLPLGSSSAQDAITLELAARAMMTNEFPVPAMEAYGRTGVDIGFLGRAKPAADTDMTRSITLISYRMAPDSVLQPHNHPNYCVATVGLEGEARVAHFEPEGATPAFPSREGFTVRKTAERLLRPGEASTLSPKRDNIHMFRAGPRGARFVDLFFNQGGDVGFSYLDLAASGDHRDRRDLPRALGGNDADERLKAGVRTRGARVN